MTAVSFPCPWQALAGSGLWISELSEEWRQRRGDASLEGDVPRRDKGVRSTCVRAAVWVANSEASEPPLDELRRGFGIRKVAPAQIVLRLEPRRWYDSLQCPRRSPRCP
jgi:hypothetical protein